ncbi:MAG: hypothetical protein KJO49_04245 [Bacteroidia bacterium]|nr:hypothetical protein [Bacteroidia bacterium]MBT8269720.1 hypothetical protein [Bacteroidia bacterium]NNF83137.1 hypothetical protein [Flavobacteriaceae bacterium]NNK71132.1 hypothetical protein [Flavobacteriaceae bacterium]NNL80782.1 hypothetical protein [Flavobacteriaceae bacterium]
MLRQLIAFGFVLVAWNATADTTPKDIPLDDILALEIEQMELELDLFGDAYYTEEAISIESIELYQLEEEVEIGFDTADYLPDGFNPKEGMNDIDWTTIELYEVEEEDDFDFNTKDYLPVGFNPYKGMDCNTHGIIMLSSRL